jgi:hypothetical protein
MCWLERRWQCGFCLSEPYPKEIVPPSSSCSSKIKFRILSLQRTEGHGWGTLAKA